MTRGQFSVVVIVGLALGLSIWTHGSLWHALSRGFAGIQDKSGVEYITAEVSKGRIHRTITATGSLRAVSTVEVSSQLSGQIEQVYADYNDTVEFGEPLARLDQRRFRASVKQKQAELAMARENLAIRSARLEQARSAQREAVERRKVFQARTDKARAALKSAEQRLARLQPLVERGASSQSSLDDARLARDTAAAALRETEAHGAVHEHVVASTRAGLQEARAELANARAAVPRKDAELALARIDLERSVIRAPGKGVLVRRNVEQGQTVAASLNAPDLFTIAGDLTEMEIHANIDETDIGEIAGGQTAEFTVDAYPNRRFAAEVSEIRKSPRIVDGLVIYTVVLTAPNPQRLLLPGMTTTVQLSIDEVGPVRTLPFAALSFSPERKAPDLQTGEEWNRAGVERTVWVLDGEGVRQPRRVSLGIDDGRNVVVLKGNLATGDRVITGRAARPADQRWLGIRF